MQQVHVDRALDEGQESGVVLGEPRDVANERDFASCRGVTHGFKRQDDLKEHPRLVSRRGLAHEEVFSHELADFFQAILILASGCD